MNWSVQKFKKDYGINRLIEISWLEILYKKNCLYIFLLCFHFILRAKTIDLVN